MQKYAKHCKTTTCPHEVTMKSQSAVLDASLDVTAFHRGIGSELRIGCDSGRFIRVYAVLCSGLGLLGLGSFPNAERAARPVAKAGDLRPNPLQRKIRYPHPQSDPR